MNSPASTSSLGRIFPDLTPVRAQSAPGQRGRQPKASEDRVRELFETGLGDQAIATALGCSLATVRLRRSTMGLLRRQKAGPAAEGPVCKSRHPPKPMDDKIATMPPVNHPALSGARTLYPATVSSATGLLNVFVTGDNSWKIGGRVTKGQWRGFPIYTLTLQERATCPTSCAHWRSCFGNHMNWAKRIIEGPALEERIGFEIGLFSHRHPNGFAVRLHVLGDFYSVAYVDLWRAMIERFPNLHVFGFSARIDLDDPIAIALAAVIVDHWPRFAIRLSNAPYRVGTTVSIEHPLQKPVDAIVCPQQTGRTASCGTCALCWSTDRRIAFLRH